MKLPEYEYNALFRPTAKSQVNAAVGTNGGPYSFRDYATGFFVAGHHIFKRVLKEPRYVDVIVYPMAFNYRHGIELYLKSLLLHSLAALEQPPTMQKSHGILDNWDSLKEKIAHLDDRIFQPKQEIEAVERVLRDFCQIDPTGQTFRYPEDFKGNQHLLKQDLISLEVLYKAMKALQKVFDKWSDGISEVYAANPL